jgi:hypothetical protein
VREGGLSVKWRTGTHASFLVSPSYPQRERKEQEDMDLCEAENRQTSHQQEEEIAALKSQLEKASSELEKAKVYLSRRFVWWKGRSGANWRGTEVDSVQFQ